MSSRTNVQTGVGQDNGGQLCEPLFLVFVDLSGGQGTILDSPQV
jgi:hypothetical protein